MTLNPAPCQLLLICGSSREGSTNAAVLETIAANLQSGWRAQRYQGLKSLPIFDPDDDYPPLAPAVMQLRSAIGEADGLLICTPEYAGALPAALKNLLEWTVGGGEMIDKPVAWINIAGLAAPTGGADAHDSLRKVLGYVSARIVDEACVRVPVARNEIADGLLAAPEKVHEVLGAVRRFCAAIEV
jgi:chromate reductase